MIHPRSPRVGHSLRLLLKILQLRICALRRPARLPLSDPLAFVTFENGSERIPSNAGVIHAHVRDSRDGWRHNVHVVGGICSYPVLRLLTRVLTMWQGLLLLVVIGRRSRGTLALACIITVTVSSSLGVMVLEAWSGLRGARQGGISWLSTGRRRDRTGVSLQGAIHRLSNRSGLLRLLLIR
jgi:hypothetical protein